MKNPFNRFALRYLVALLCGILLFMLHRTVQGGAFAVFVPQCASAWELSKLAFWPMLCSLLVTGRMGEEKRPLCCDLPALVLTSLVLVVLDWAVLAWDGGGGLCMSLWVALLAAGLTVGPNCGWKRRPVWAALAVVLACAYILLTFLAPAWGPFSNPAGAIPAGY